MHFGESLPLLQHYSLSAIEAFLNSCIAEEFRRAQGGASEANGAIGGKAHTIRTKAAERLGHSGESSLETYQRAAVHDSKPRS